MRKVLIASFLLLLIAKTAVVLTRGPVSIEMDAQWYWRLSALVMAGDIWLYDAPIAYRTPVYPWFLAANRLAFSQHALAAIVAIQGALSIASVWLASRIAVRITHLPSAGPITLALSLACVSAVPFAAAVLSEVVFVFLLLLGIDAVVRYGDRPSPIKAAWVGVTFTSALLTRPIVLLVWIAYGIYLLSLWWLRRKRGLYRAKTLFRDGLIAASVAILLLSPWLVRNQRLFGNPFVTEFVGRNLWIVTFQDGSGAGLEFAGTNASDQLSKRLDRVGITEDRDLTWTVAGGLVRSGLDDAQSDRLMKRVAIDAIKENQTPFARKAFRRIINFWRTRATELPEQSASGQFFGQSVWQFEQGWVDRWIDYRASNSLAFNTILMTMMGLSTGLIVLHRPSRSGGLLLIALLGYFSVVTGILEIPAYRYRMVIEPLVAASIGSAIAIVMSKRTRPAKMI